MALSNIFREPRREITETVVGVFVAGVVIVVAGYLDYRAAKAFEIWCGYDSHGWANFPWEMGMILGLIVAVVGVLLLMLTHLLGEAICETLDDHGIRLRPRR